MKPEVWHFTKDVLAGAAIGSGSAWLFTKQLGVNSAAMIVPTHGGAWIKDFSSRLANARIP